MSGNFTVKQIINIIKKFRKKIKIKFVKSKIMNQLSYFVDDKKIKKLGLVLNFKIENDIKETLAKKLNGKFNSADANFNDYLRSKPTCV